MRCPRGKYFFLFSNLPPDGTGAGEMDLMRGYESSKSAGRMAELKCASGPGRKRGSFEERYKVR